MPAQTTVVANVLNREKPAGAYTTSSWIPRPLLSLTELISLWIYYKWVLTTHGANQLAHLLRHARPPRLTVTDLPRPEQAKAFAVPADDGRGFDDKDAGLPVVPDGAEPSPE